MLSRRHALVPLSCAPLPALASCPRPALAHLLQVCTAPRAPGGSAASGARGVAPRRQPALIAAPAAARRSRQSALAAARHGDRGAGHLPPGLQGKCRALSRCLPGLAGIAAAPRPHFGHSCGCAGCPGSLLAPRLRACLRAAWRLGCVRVAALPCRIADEPHTRRATFTSGIARWHENMQTHAQPPFPRLLQLRFRLFLPLHALCVALVGSVWVLPSHCGGDGAAPGVCRVRRPIWPCRAWCHAKGWPALLETQPTALQMLRDSKPCFPAPTMLRAEVAASDAGGTLQSICIISAAHKRRTLLLSARCLQVASGRCCVPPTSRCRCSSAVPCRPWSFTSLKRARASASRRPSDVCGLEGRRPRAPRGACRLQAMGTAPHSTRPQSSITRAICSLTLDQTLPLIHGLLLQSPVFSSLEHSSQGQAGPAICQV